MVFCCIRDQKEKIHQTMLVNNYCYIENKKFKLLYKAQIKSINVILYFTKFFIEIPENYSIVWG